MSSPELNIASDVNDKLQVLNLQLHNYTRKKYLRQ